MAKIFNCICGILFLCSCHNSSVHEISVEQIEPTKLDSAKKDIPVQVDTTFADTATVVIEIKKDTVVEQMPSGKKDTVIVKQEAKPSLQKIYTSFIGVREKTGNNDGVEVEMFLKSVGLGKGYAWCAAFVKYCLLQANVKAAEKINGMALSAVNYSEMVYNKGKKIKDIKAGDVGTLYYPSLKRIGHTFFIDKEINSSIYESVEGNTNGGGSRDGDGVYRRKRSYNSTYNISRWIK